MTRMRTIRCWSILVLAAVVWLLSSSAGLAQQQAGGASQPGTKWSDEQLRQAVAMARVGKS